MVASIRKKRNLDNSAPSGISRKDFEDYLSCLYFGSIADLLHACIDRAYLDFNRTLHGLGKIKNASVIKIKAVDLSKSQLQALKLLLAKPITSDVFDDWHKITCKMLISHYEENGFHFFVGQAQEWINMTLKYMFTFGEQRIPGYEKARPHCHAPIDNILLQKLKKYGFPPLNCAWSRLDDYEEYLNRQKWIRETFGEGPLDIEFRLWLGNDIET
jgi:hypothetical protein